MNANKKLESLYSTMNKLHAERSSHFYDEDSKAYWRANKELNQARKDVENFLHWCKSEEIDMDGEIPVFNGHTGCCYTRYETLPAEIQGQIFSIAFSYGSWAYLYATKAGLARNLKDAVASLR